MELNFQLEALSVSITMHTQGSYRSVAATITKKVRHYFLPELSDIVNTGASSNSWQNALEGFKLKRNERRRTQVSRSHHTQLPALPSCCLQRLRAPSHSALVHLPPDVPTTFHLQNWNGAATLLGTPDIKAKCRNTFAIKPFLFRVITLHLDNHAFMLIMGRRKGRGLQKEVLPFTGCCCSEVECCWVSGLRRKHLCPSGQESYLLRRFQGLKNK